jgi:hypothetical protein
MSGPDGVEDFDVAAGVTTFRFRGNEPYRAKNGETIIYDIDVDRGSHLSIVGPDNRAELNLRCKRTDKCTPAILSADGSLIAYRDECDKACGGDYGAYTLVRDRRGRLRQYFKDMSPSDWVDGRLVMYGTAGQGGIYISSNSGLARRINERIGGVNPRVSPDGTSVAFEWRDHVWTMGINGEDPKQITYDNKERYPAWSPDGKWIAVQFRTTKFGTEPSYRIVLVSPDGRRTIPLKKRDGGEKLAFDPITWR